MTTMTSASQASCCRKIATIRDAQLHWMDFGDEEGDSQGLCFLLLLQAKLAGPVVELLQQHGQAIDPNLMQLAEAWKQVEAALQAQGKSVPDTPAEEADEEEQEAAAVVGGSSSVIAEDLQVRLTSCV